MPRTPPAAYLIDAPIYVFRAYHSLPTTLTDGQGRPVNAVYGYAQFLCGLLRGERPLYCAAAFDESLTRSFRNEWFEAYKANREEPPPDLEAQFAFCKRLTRALGVLTYASRRFEADDLIATAAKGLRSEGLSVVIVSRDKDLAQILEPGDCLWDGTGGPRLGPADIRARLGVQPSQISDYLGLVGDPVDNIPGVPGIGPGAARQLLERFDTLDDLYRCLDTVARLDIRGASRLRGLTRAAPGSSILEPPARYAAYGCPHPAPKNRPSVARPQGQGSGPTVSRPRLRQPPHGKMSEGGA